MKETGAYVCVYAWYSEASTAYRRHLCYSKDDVDPLERAEKQSVYPLSAVKLLHWVV